MREPIAMTGERRARILQRADMIGDEARASEPQRERMGHLRLVLD